MDSVVHRPKQRFFRRYLYQQCGIALTADFVNTGYQELEPLEADFAAAATLAMKYTPCFF